MPPDVRVVTVGEKSLLRSIFASTLPYDDIWIGINVNGWGGPTNSITPGTVPNFAPGVWMPDFTAASYDIRWIFIHEMTHVWQTYHGNSNAWCAIKIWWHYDNYEDSYAYDLSARSHLGDFNMEQQASIVPDYWYVKNGKTPKLNKGTLSKISDYEPFIREVQGSGPPRDLAKYANRADSRPL